MLTQHLARSNDAVKSTENISQGRVSGRLNSGYDVQRVKKRTEGRLKAGQGAETNNTKIFECNAKKTRFDVCLIFSRGGLQLRKVNSIDIKRTF